jgi:GntR family transcriptional regulator / MocR family aminotransferase
MIENAPPARLAYVTPSHQFPLAAVLSAHRRKMLLEWAEQHDGYIIEDDYDTEFAFDVKPQPALQSIDRSGRVIYVNSFSKTLAPGLRLGYIIVPSNLVEIFSIARLISRSEGTGYVLETLAEFISQGHFARHVHRMSKTYRKSHAKLVDLLERKLPAGFSISDAGAGLHLAIVGPNDFRDTEVAELLSRQGVFVEPLSAFCIERTDCRGFLIGYSSAPSDQVVEAAATLVKAIADYR